MSCHFLFREAWLINFNRWFLLAFTQPFLGFWFRLYYHFLFYLLFPFLSVCSRNVTDLGLLCNLGWVLIVQSHRGRGIMNTVWRAKQCATVNQCTLNDFDADFNLCGIRASWDWERAPSDRQSAQIIPSWGASQLTGLAFRLNTFFSSVSGQAYVIWRNVGLTITEIWALYWLHLMVTYKQGEGQYGLTISNIAHSNLVLIDLLASNKIVFAIVCSRLVWNLHVHTAIRNK